MLKMIEQSVSKKSTVRDKEREYEIDQWSQMIELLAWHSKIDPADSDECIHRRSSMNTLGRGTLNS